MKKILFTSIVSILSIIAGLAFVLCLGIIFYFQSNIVIHELNEVIEEVESEYNESKVTGTNASIAFIVNNALSIYDRAVFVIDKESGKIEGFSKNNEQGLNFENASTKEEFITALEDGQEGSLVTINGSLKYLKTKEVDHKIIGAYKQADTVFRTVQLQFSSLFSVMLFIVISAWIIIRYNIKKYILTDLLSIESNIKSLMDGNYDVIFETKYNTEFTKICKILNYWKDIHKSKSERMTRIISSINSHVAVFECLYSINENFFSDNMQSILGVDDDVWNEIKTSPRSFDDYVSFLASSSEGEDEIIKVNQRFIKIVSFRSKDEFYGMILNKTEDEKQKEKIQQELHNIQEESEMDPLTKLVNRAGLEKYIKKWLAETPGKGIMLIFDLDNFKVVNDELGHPEGDKVLKKFASCLSSCFRQEDIVARMGGDEFAVFIRSHLSDEVIKQKLISLLNVIREELSVYYQNYGVSTSIGVAYVDNMTNRYEDLYKCADVALYMAKRYGKDRYYFNIENVRCMKNQCVHCTKDCQRGKVLQKPE